jgi:hypothetical protein
MNTEVNWREVAEQLYQAAWFAEPFVAHAADNAANNTLAAQCRNEVGVALATYRKAIGLRTQPEDRRHGE